MRLLDLFCGAGGCSVGYARAGFDVVGVDLHPQPNYPYEFLQDDAVRLLEFLLKRRDDDPRYGAGDFRLADFDAIHASPPCGAYSMSQNAAKNAHAHPRLIAPTRELLIATGLTYVIENVVGAPLIEPTMICGLSMGVNVKRHRLFETNWPLMAPPCSGHERDYFVVFGHEVRNRRHGSAAGRKNKIAAGRIAMGIDWMTRGELSQAIPPAYTEFIGHQLAQWISTSKTPTRGTK